MSASVDVAIIGGGAVGCFAAYFLRQRGRSVLVLEKGAACSAASGSNFGNLRLQGRHPAQFPLALRAQAIWQDLARLAGEDAGLNACGHVYLGLGPSDQPKLAQTAAEARDAGLDVDLLSGPVARQRWPKLSPLVSGACWSRRDAIADPGRAAPVIARLAQRAGAEVLESTRAHKITPSAAGFHITGDRGLSVSCGHVINAAGAWGAEVAAALGEEVPLFAAGPPLFTLRSERGWDGPSLAAIDGTVLLRPGPGGEAVAGAFPRVKADLVSGTAPVPPDRVARGLARLTAVLPGLGRLRAGRVWSGVEGYLPDLLPVLDWSQTTPGLLHAFGFCGHGYQLAPGVGAVLAELIASGTSKTPIDAFAITRFAGGITPDAKLWHEFDPELVARFQPRRPAAAGAPPPTDPRDP